MLNGLGLGGFGDPSDPFGGTFGLGGSSFAGRRLMQNPFASPEVDPFASAASANPFGGGSSGGGAPAPPADPFSSSSGSGEYGLRPPCSTVSRV